MNRRERRAFAAKVSRRPEGAKLSGDEVRGLRRAVAARLREMEAQQAAEQYGIEVVRPELWTPEKADRKSLWRRMLRR